MDEHIAIGSLADVSDSLQYYAAPVKHFSWVDACRKKNLSTTKTVIPKMFWSTKPFILIMPRIKTTPPSLWKILFTVQMLPRVMTGIWHYNGSLFKFPDQL